MKTRMNRFRARLWPLALLAFMACATVAQARNVLANPGFENGPQPWVATSTSLFSIVISNPIAYTGAALALLGGYEGGTDTLSQNVTIPADSQRAYVQFWYRVATFETSTTVVHDTMQVFIVDVVTGDSTVLATFSNLDGNDWDQSRQYDVTAFKGRAVRLKFTAVNDSADVTAFLIDDVVLGSSAPGDAVNYSDIWSNAGEPGWGVTIADHETQMFAVWYTYRADGRPTWFALPGGAFSENRRFFTGDLYQTTGPAYSSAFDPHQVSATRVGSASFDFTPSGIAPGHALFTYTVNGITRTKEIERQAFGTASPDWGHDRTDIWWNPLESGWGLALAQHGDNVFGVWFTYDTDGQPLFVVLPGAFRNGSAGYEGNLYTTTGPYYGNATFDPSQVRATLVGGTNITFAGSTGSFGQSIHGFPRTMPIQQQTFGHLAPAE